MASIADGKNPVVPSTIDDPSVLDALRLVLHREPGIERFGPGARVPTGRPSEDSSRHAASHATSQGAQSGDATVIHPAMLVTTTSMRQTGAIPVRRAPLQERRWATERGAARGRVHRATP